MIGEFDFSGIFLSPVLISGVIALIAHLVVRRGLVRVGAYRIVWHPPLFDAALFVVVWAAVASFPLPELR